jgi:hypothetical protein
MAKEKKPQELTLKNEDNSTSILIINPSKGGGVLTEWTGTTKGTQTAGKLVPACHQFVHAGKYPVPALANDPWFPCNLDLPAKLLYPMIGDRLAEVGDVYRNPDRGSGLIVTPACAGDLPQEVTKGVDLGVVIKDRLPIWLFKNGKPAGERFPSTTLNDMLKSELFLGRFLVLDRVADRPEFFGDYQLTGPGYNDGGERHRVYYPGPKPEVLHSQDAINRFLDVMAFASNADRTNAVAAALTVQMRHFWPGDKPFVLITSTKSHGGKDTTLDFVKGETMPASVSYEAADWAFQKAVVSAIKSDRRLGLIDVGNVRVEGREISSAFLERFLTDSHPVLHAIGTGPDVRRPNHWVVAMTTNIGAVSTDLMNRAIPIHLTPKGDVGSRVSPIGNPRYEYLRANRGRIAAELRGMVATWNEAGRPLGIHHGHSRTEWAKTIGGILTVNGYSDFLGNLSMRRTTDDPVRSALALLATELPAADQWMPPIYLLGAVTEFGLTGRLIPKEDRESPSSRQRALVKRLNAHTDETVEAEDDGGRFRLERQRTNDDDGRPVNVYRFVRLDGGADATK